MDRLLVVVFDSESKAYNGKKALQRLDTEGDITIYTYAVVTKNVDGSSTVKESDDVGPAGVLGGTPVGSLICLLGGPVELAGGATPDACNARIGEDFVDGVVKVFFATQSGARCGGGRRLDDSAGHSNGVNRRNRVPPSSHEREALNP
jgi:uncharacterized membrane protein